MSTVGPQRSARSCTKGDDEAGPHVGYAGAAESGWARWAVKGRILDLMKTPPHAPRSHLASSPFQAAPAPVIARFELHDRVCHQSYGLGRVVGEESAAVTVDFGNCTVRIVSPFPKLEKI
jgi:hypothetical protein